MLIDETEIVVKAGHGGAGRVSFHKPPLRGPDGGNGGKGGDVYVIGTTDLSALRRYSVKGMVVEANNGENGGSNKRFGKDGADTTMIVPIGTVFIDTESGDEIEIISTNEPLRIAKGGLGGKGNAEFKSSRNTTPEYAQPGLPGEQKEYVLNLRLIADFGFIGLPNAGKSSLLNELTAAKVKTADYPFTTLEPNLGVCQGKILADIPGLIEGASGGKGLGITFLKHIEKVNTLLHCISAQDENPDKSYLTIRNELGLYNPNLLDKPEIIILTKTDMINPSEVKQKAKIISSFNKTIFPVSIHDFDSLENLKKVLLS